MTQIQQQKTFLDSSLSQIDVPINLNKLKIQYLSEQKQNLQTELRELKLNNRILRKINQEYNKNQKHDVIEFVRRNKEMEETLIKFGKQNKELRSQILLLNQVGVQNQKQYKFYLENYQSKIYELRLLLHQKQGHAQMLEERQRLRENDKEIQLSQCIRSPFFVANLIYIEEIQELKMKIKEMNSKCIQLSIQNEKLKNQNQQLLLKLCHVYKFLQFKDGNGELKDFNYQPSLKPCTKQSFASTCDVNSSVAQSELNVSNTLLAKLNSSGSLYSNYIEQMLMRIVKKKIQCIRGLEGKIRDLQLKNAHNILTIQYLKESNEIYQKQRLKTLKNIESKTTVDKNADSAEISLQKQIEKERQIELSFYADKQQKENKDELREDFEMTEIKSKSTLNKENSSNLRQKYEVFENFFDDL